MFSTLGVRLFQRLSFLRKVGVISLVFGLVVAQLGYLYVQGSAHITMQSERESQGLALVSALLPTFQQAQGLRAELLAGDGKGSAESRRMLAGVEQQLAAFGSRVAGSEYEEPLKFVLQALEPLKAPAEDGEEAFKKADEFAQQLQRLTVAIADLSGLSMDPEMASYHLMLASTQEAQAAVGMLARVRDLGAHAMKTKDASAAAKRTIAGDTYVLYRQIELLFARYERVVKARADLEAGLEYQKAFDPVNTFVRGWRRGVLAPSGPAGDAAAFASAGTAAVDGLLALTQRSHQALGQLLEQRSQAAVRARLIQIALVAVGLCVTAYLFFCFYLVTRGSMRELTRHIEAMSKGDLTTHPQPVGTDEAAELMHSLREMQQAVRKLIGEVRLCADDIALASAEVSNGAEDLSVRTESTAARLQQTAATMDGIAASVRDTNTRVEQSAQRGQDAASAATRSQAAIDAVVTHMQEVESSAKRVGDILGVIDSIAFQTNILALNAAVEAARAGENGRGFAVVASEVRQLAQRSAQAAKDIKSLLSGSALATQHGVRSVREASSTMEVLAGNVREISTLLQDVSSAAGRQTADIGDVTGTVSQLDGDTQRNAALVEQTTAATLSMRAKADTLAELASRFKLPDSAGHAAH